MQASTSDTSNSNKERLHSIESCIREQLLKGCHDCDEIASGTQCQERDCSHIELRPEARFASHIAANFAQVVEKAQAAKAGRIGPELPPLRTVPARNAMFHSAAYTGPDAAWRSLDFKCSSTFEWNDIVHPTELGSAQRPAG